MLAWLDLETTGLNPATDKILSIATVVTDNDLNIVAKGQEIIIHQTDDVLDNMNEWCVNQHGKSGLTDKVRASKHDLIDSEVFTLIFLEGYMNSNTSPMCGNSISQDRRFLRQYMSSLHEYFTYQHIDVSTTKLLCEMWYPNIPPYVKNSTHLAMDDVLESINELKYYREHMMK